MDLRTLTFFSPLLPPHSDPASQSMSSPASLELVFGILDDIRPPPPPVLWARLLVGNEVIQDRPIFASTYSASSGALDPSATSSTSQIGEGKYSILCSSDFPSVFFFWQESVVSPSDSRPCLETVTSLNSMRFLLRCPFNLGLPLPNPRNLNFLDVLKRFPPSP